MSNPRQAMYVASTESFCPGMGLTINGHRFVVVSIDSPMQISIRPATWRDRLSAWWAHLRWRMRRLWWRAYDALTGRP